MKNLSIKICIGLMVFIFAGCADKPSSSQIDEQFNIIKLNVKTFLGDSYEVTKFNIVKQDYTNKNKDEYRVDFTFDLNKPVANYSEKNIPGVLVFQKSEKKWVCIFNSGNVAQLFNLTR